MSSAASERRRQLLERFRTTAPGRIRELSEKLIEIENGRRSQRAEEIGRELHTLKGEARMLGLLPMSLVLHAAEARLVAGGGGRRPGARACSDVLRALDATGRWLRGELGQEADATASFAEVVRHLEEATAAAEAAASEEAEGADDGRITEPPVSEAEHRAERWMAVRAAQVEDLCEGAATLAVEFGALSSQLGERADTPSAIRERLDRCLLQVEAVVRQSWSLRLVSVLPLLGELAQHARELARELGKRVRVRIEGREAAIERHILEELREPLVHLVRNAIDHGLEPPDERDGKPAEGQLLLQAESIGETVVITVADDGRGIDPYLMRVVAVARGFFDRDAATALSDREATELAFVHGFSTRAEVSEISGRGIGLDVVRDAVERLEGTLSLSSEPGNGTRISIAVPATLRVERALLVECAGHRYGIPVRQVVETLQLAEGPPPAVVRVTGEDVPVRSLRASLLGTPAREERSAVVIEGQNVRVAFAVGRVVGERQILRRPVDPGDAAAPGAVSATAVLGDGSMVLVLSAPGLVRRLEADGRLGTPAPVGAVPRGATPFPLGRIATPGPGFLRRPGVLIVDDSALVRELIGELLERERYRVRGAAGGQAALDELERELPGLVLLDVDMPGLDGFVVLREARQRWPTLAIVMFSTRASAEDRQKASELGAAGFVEKSSEQEAEVLAAARRHALPEE